MIVVIGDILLDEYISGTCHRVSPEGPFPVVNFSKEEIKLGGAGNVAYNIKQLEAEVTLLSTTGYNLDSDIVRQLGINFPEIREHKITPVKQRIIADNHQICRIDYEDTSFITEDSVDAIMHHVEILSPDVIVISDYAKGVITPGLLEKLHAFPGMPKVIIDPKPPSALSYENIHSYLMTPNKKEAELMSGVVINTEESMLIAATAIMRIFAATNVLITLSEKGMFLLEADGTHTLLPPETHDVIDVIGAGDTVIATIAYALANNFSLLEACKLANKAAGIVIQKHGTVAITKSELF